MHDIAVIGGGPVGSRIAALLAKAGHVVLVLEQKETPGTNVCCTGIVSQECLSEFEIPESLVLKRSESATLYSPGGIALKIERPDTRACILDRAAFDTAMVNRALKAGAEYVFASTVRKIAAGDNRVSIETLSRKGSAIFEARGVIIASGFNSRLVEELGLGSPGHFVVGTQTEVAITSREGLELYFGEEVAPGFFAWLVPTSPGRGWAGVLTQRSPARYLTRLLSKLASQDKIIPQETEPRFGRVPLKPLRRTYQNRLLVAGTAAGQVKPTTGGGIYYGLLCADIAATTMQQALEEDDLSASGLAGYEREWQHRLGRELKKGYRLRRFYDRLSDPEIDGLFRTLKANGLTDALLHSEDISFDFHSHSLLKMLGSLAAIRVGNAFKKPFRRGGEKDKAA